MEINKIYQEDNLSTMSRMSADIIDLTITSPPYDNLRVYKGHSFEFEKLAQELYRVTKEGGVVVWVVGDATIKGSETGTSFRQALYFMEVGFRLHDTMIYQKKNFTPQSHRRYEQCWEYMFIFSKGRPKTFNAIRVKSIYAGKTYNYSKKGSNTDEGVYRRRDEVVKVQDTKIASNIFEYSVGASGSKHPAPFPEALVRDHITSWSSEGDLIYDPFMGSGTTAKVARIYERKFIGSEISEEYCKMAKNRLSGIIH